MRRCFSPEVVAPKVLKALHIGKRGIPTQVQAIQLPQTASKPFVFIGTSSL
jgi:hypothetical protein